MDGGVVEVESAVVPSVEGTPALIFAFVMDVEVVPGHMDLDVGIGNCELLHEGDQVVGGPSGSDLGEDFSGVGIEGCDERAGSVADVLELLASGFPRDGRLCRVLSSEGLQARLETTKNWSEGLSSRLVTRLYQGPPVAMVDHRAMALPEKEET